MGQAVLVDRQIEGGEERIRQIRDAGIDVTAAFWLKASDDDRWYLYIASTDVDQHGATNTYRKTYAATSRKRIPWVDFFQLKLIRTDNPLAKAAIDRTGPDLPTVYQQSFLGDVSIDEAYIYPQSVIQ